MKADHDFHHPYQPYKIQQEFMTALYNVIEGGKIGIFESPTGTGKTLSLICGSMTWLREFTDMDVGADHEDVSTEPAWVIEQDRDERRNKFLHDRLELRKRLLTVRKPASSTDRSVRIKRSRQGETEKMLDKASDEQYLVNECDIDEKSHSTTTYTPEVLKLLRSQGHIVDTEAQSELLTIPVKIYFASRTHSQLSQFAQELRKVKFPLEGSDQAMLEQATSTALASRKNLCINPRVSSLPSEALNEACLDMQNGSKKSTTACKFLTNDSAKLEFRDQALAEIMDIEDYVELGQKLKVCPYYSTRSALPASEVVTLPYPLLINRSAREALEIDLRGQVVIIDEAHNLIDAVTNIASASVSEEQLEGAQAALAMYLKKFENRLKGSNKMYIQQLLRLISILSSFLANHRFDGLTGAAELSGSSDGINIYKITEYLQQSKLARKVDGYCQSLQPTKHKSTPVLTIVQGFLECLTNPADEGRFFHKQIEAGMILEYMLLDPANTFSTIVEQARSVVLAGGTMEPMSDFVNVLFPKHRARAEFFSCGHVVSEHNLLAMIVSSGSSSRFDFTYQRRADRAMLGDLGRTISNLIGTVPDGVIVFFASYAYLAQVLSIWDDLGIMSIMQKKKPIFQESKDKSVDEVLAGYTQSIQNKQGGLLFAVVGGKMSEGINFSDTLGRAIIMVGLPFPNANTIEWQTKLKFMADKTSERLRAEGISSLEAERLGKIAGQEYYENAAMRAVNQSIGRAIRHANDYAAIILIDQRYGLAPIQAKLPKWIKSGLHKDAMNLGQAIAKTGQFFRSKKLN